jgi:DNA topoisomerase-1
MRSRIRLRSSGRGAARARDKATLTRGKTSEKLEAFKLQMVDREAEKKLHQARFRSTISILGARPCRAITVFLVFIQSDLLSFFAHRIAAAWCKKHDVLIDKIFSKTLLMKCA